MASMQKETQRRSRNIKHMIPSPQSGLSTSITLLEQAIFVNASLATPSVLRGSVKLSVSKYVQIRDLVIKFRGVNKTGKFAGFNDEDCIVDHTWPVPQLETHYGVIHPNEAGCRRQWPLLRPGQYTYDFELTLDRPLPETFNVGGCKLNYHIQAIASLSGLRRQVSQNQEVTVVHCPHDDIYLHESNQISLSRIWNRQILYNVELADKSGAIGGNVPVAVRIGCSKILYIAIQVYLGQKIKFPGIPGRQSQIQKKLLLKSKCNDMTTGKFSDVSSLQLDQESGTTIITGSVPLRDEPSSQLKLHPDVNFQKVKATHTLLFLVDITIPNAHDTKKHTVCRLTAETPFCIRSSHTQMFDLSVPQYTETHDLTTDCSHFNSHRVLPPPFHSPILSPRSSYTPSVNSDYLQLSHQASSFRSSISSTSSIAAEGLESRTPLSPPPTYDSILWAS